MYFSRKESGIQDSDENLLGCGMRDSREKRARMWDQDPPFQTLVTEHFCFEINKTNKQTNRRNYLKKQLKDNTKKKASKEAHKAVN